MKKSANLALLLVGSLALSQPLLARNGADDSGSSGSAGSSGSSGASSSSARSGSAGTDESSGSSGSSGTSSSSSKSGRSGTDDNPGSSGSSGNSTISKGSLDTTGTLPGLHVKFKYVDRKKRDRQELEINAKVKLGGDLTRANAEDLSLVAVFPDGSECDLEYDHITGAKAEYKVRLLQRSGGTIQDKAGTCTIVPASANLSDLLGGRASIQDDKGAELAAGDL